MYMKDKYICELGKEQSKNEKQKETRTDSFRMQSHVVLFLLLQIGEAQADKVLENSK